MCLERLCFILELRECEFAYETEGMPVRILIADDWPNVQNALRVLLEQQPGLVVVGGVVDVGELLARIEDNCPDTVLLGWELPGLEGGDLLPTLRIACPDMYVIVLSGRPGARRAALAAGADAFVSKVAPPERLLSVILHLGQTEKRARCSLDDRLCEQRQRRPWIAPLGDAPRDDRDRRTMSHLPGCRRSTMVEVEKKGKDTLKYVAIIAVGAVLLGCIAAGLAISLVLINEIPFSHIFPR
jgi:DNA-binding NarL/FixJ family response regulator